MKFISYLKEGQDQLAFVVNDMAYDTDGAHPELPGNMEFFLQLWDEALPYARQARQVVADGAFVGPKGTPLDQLELMAPVPFPCSCRDAYSFRQHVETARRNRGAKMISEFDQFPVFYFTNHHAIYGPGEITCMPDHFQRLDFELEVAVVICKQGRNIRAEQADEYIGGLMILNDFSARRLQAEEMKLNLGPAKGKDFATAMGPWLITPDELEAFKTAPRDGHTGNAYKLKMTCRVNGKQVSEGNLADMDWTFAEIIERCSYGVDLLPGDVIGSGTVGTGCFLELNGTGKLNQPEFQEQWLQPGDEVELEVEALGVLKNTIRAEETDYSLLQLKKNIV
ncbi:MAG TPA: fumarylacetoacetate hydrolase family protein [Chitinophagaceae bacterium]|nr:fumarylacetoacetate hydrolase family protein [Chitinophagaceae bacterium]